MMTGKLENGLGGASPDNVAAAILVVLAEKRIGSSICPADAARRVAADKHETDPDNWHRLFGTVRRVVQDLARSGKIDILRTGRMVKPAGVRNAIRLWLRRSTTTDPEQA